MHTIKFCSVVFSITLKLLVIKLHFVIRLLRTTHAAAYRATSDECHQLAAVRHSCVYNTWQSQS